MFERASLHPLLVHVPLVLLPAAVAFMVLDMLRPGRGFRLTAVLLLIAGVGGATIAAASGEAAEHAARQALPRVRQIAVSGVVPSVLGQHSLLETHAALGELTRNLYGLLLLAEGGIIVLSAPVLARFRRGFTLPATWRRTARGVWVTVAVAGIVLVVFTGHYGGKLVYDHGVGTQNGPAAVQAP